MKKTHSHPFPYHHEYVKTKGCTWIGHPEIITSLKQFLAAADSVKSQCLVLKDRPNLIIETHFLENKDFPWPVQVIKKFRERGIHAFLLSPFKGSKAMKSFSAAYHLIKHGLQTPVPLAAYESRRLGFIRQNIFVTEKIPEHVVLRNFIKQNRANSDQIKEVLRALAEFAGKMHDSGFWHRDMNLSNFLLTGNPGNYKLLIIDLNRGRIRDELFIWHRAMDLARLDLDEWQETFFRYYCKDRFDIKMMLKMANTSRIRRSFWRKMVVWTNPLRIKLGLK